MSSLDDFEIIEKINWRAPKADYEKIYSLRGANVERLIENQEQIPKVLSYYADGHWAEFISDFFITYDPRELDPDLKYRPFFLYPRQVDYVNFVYQRYINQERGLCKKFRGAGMSWLNAAIAVTIFLTIPNSVVTMGSQKEEKVDNGPQDPDSLFWKIRKILETLPAVLVPDWRSQSKTMVVSNPLNGSIIRGEIGDQIGRGGRATIVFPDEFAELEHQELVEAALAETANCVIYGSTVPTTGGVGSKFYELEHLLPEDQVFVFQWFEDPRKRLNPDLPPEEEPWFIKKRSEISPNVFNSQFLLDYSAATSNGFIPSHLVLDANNRSKMDISTPSEAAWRIGIDASGMGADKTKIWRRRGRISLPVITLEKMDGIQLAMIVENEVKTLLKLGPVELIGIEQDGPGGSCADQLSYGPFAKIVASVHTGAKLADGKHYNLRAWLHTQAKEYLQSQFPYIPTSQTFLSQATAIQYEHKGGLLLIESKKDYRARFSAGRSRVEKLSGKSPDEWDSFVLTFIPPIGEPITELRVRQFDQVFSPWKPLDSVMGY